VSASQGEPSVPLAKVGIEKNHCAILSLQSDRIEETAGPMSLRSCRLLRAILWMAADRRFERSLAIASTWRTLSSGM
jgi:hypothetical protein